MKFNHNGTEVQTSGQIENNKVSIDTANIDFIITILSTNLYSNPIQSFLRETVSNAWDSHMEAGVTEPVILELGTNTEGQDYCKIQDFGVGLSPERFNTVYRNIGSSTKRDSNTQIGGFGIGRFSALAYSDMVNITSIFDGQEYEYLMYKDGNSISIDLLHQKPTNNRNGVTVKVNIKNGDTTNFIKGIRSQLSYFENLFIDTTYLKTSENAYHSVVVLYDDIRDMAKDFNESVIKKYNNFYVSSINKYKMSILLGKVLYPLNINELTSSVNTYGLDFQHYPIALKFDIGELEVTPNREQILYTDRNIATIEDKLNKALAEIQDIITETANKDYTDLEEYINAIKTKMTITLLSQDDKTVEMTVPGAVSNATLNGVKYDNKPFIETYNAIRTVNMFPVSFKIYNGQLSGSESLNFTKLNISNTLSNLDKVYISTKSELNNYTKSWIRETFKQDSLFIYPIKNNKDIIKKYVKEVKALSLTPGYNRNAFLFDMKNFKVIARYFFDKLKSIKTITNTSTPQSYIDKKKAEMKLKRGLSSKSLVDWKLNMNLYPLRQSNVQNKMVPEAKTISLGDLKKEYKKILVVYDEKDSATLRRLASILLYDSDTKFIEVAPTKMKHLEKLPNFIHLDKYMETPNYSALRNIATAQLIKENFPNLVYLNKIKNLNKISERLSESVHKLFDFMDTYLSRFRPSNQEDKDILKEICSICEEKNYYNEEMLLLMNSNKNLIQDATFLIDFSSGMSNEIPNKQLPTILDYVVARKLFLPNTQVLNEIKNPQILTNENN